MGGALKEPWVLARLFAMVLLLCAGSVQADAVAGAVQAPATATVPSPGQILAIPPELADLLQEQVVARSTSHTRRLDLLARFIFDPDGLGIRYRHDANYTVAETYQAREANCLSFTLLTIALARAAGLDAYGQHVAQALSWHSENGQVVRSSHVNAGIFAEGRRFSVDVASDNVLTQEPPARVSDEALIALFHSNHAVAAMIAGDLAKAHALLSLAQEFGPELAQIWSNAGVLHVRSNQLTAAENAYLKAIALAPKDSTALFNLASLYRRTGERDQAAMLERQAQRVLSRDPFHQFQQAIAAENAGDPATALKHFRRAIRLHPNEARFHLGMARSYLALSDERRAVLSLARASEVGSGGDQARLQAKLEHLRSREPGCCPTLPTTQGRPPVY